MVISFAISSLLPLVISLYRLYVMTAPAPNSAKDSIENILENNPSYPKNSMLKYAKNNRLLMSPVNTIKKYDTTE
jgi:hypothetical protein